jgi:hypothetical protein
VGASPTRQRSSRKQSELHGGNEVAEALRDDAVAFGVASEIDDQDVKRDERQDVYRYDHQS